MHSILLIPRQVVFIPPLIIQTSCRSPSDRSADCHQCHGVVHYDGHVAFSQAQIRNNVRIRLGIFG